jgi:uroporphyrinogen decarboxylase
MTPLEIFDAALNGTPAPRIPIFCNLFDQGPRELGMTQKEYYANGEWVATGQLKLRERYGYDNVWSLFYVGREVELLGYQDILYAEDGPPNIADFVIKSYDDIAKLEVPDDITAHPVWAETAKCLKILKQEVGATHPICAYVTASTTLPTMLMGMDKWLELLLTGPVDIRDELLRKCSDFFQREIAAYRAAGANILIYATPFGSQSFLDRKRFNAIAMPWMQRDLQPGGVTNVVYLCGMAPFNSVIRQVMDELGIGVYYISPLSDLGEAKAIIGTDGLTCGVIDDIKMIHWTPEQTRAEVKRLCEIGMRDQHFLLGTALMPMAVPETNIRAMLDTAFEYGRYG